MGRFCFAGAGERQGGFLVLRARIRDAAGKHQKTGVYREVEVKEEGADEKARTWSWFCSLLEIVAETRRRSVEVHRTANEVRILEEDRIIAVHPVMEGHGQRRIIEGHRPTPPRVL